ncbi:MAG TPA: histidine kinase dimerization/phosphoacceptor domain -containing protein, partial [Ignavibacteriaceae bacterium]|nr:histidine kinase dimerization/phosphoacceptor domain -containing protein [Ignavibacteriaceae bacterium]
GKYSIVYFNPDEISDQYIPAPFSFTDLKIFNQSVPVSNGGSTILNESITTASIMEIPYNSSDIISIEFALLDFYNVKANTFHYKLSGFDDRWIYVGSKNSATYTNLPPGDYTFYVRAINNNDKRSEKEASIKLIIIPTYYQTAWFKLLAAFALLVAVFLIIQLRTRVIKNQNKLLESNVLARTKDLQASLQEKNTLLQEKEILLKEIHHRVKNNLQIISSLLYLNSKKLNDCKMLDTFRVSQNRIKSIALIHERLYQSKDLARINFKEYMQRLAHDLFTSYAVNQNLVKLELDIEDIFINVDSAVPFGLIINELISNSLKYAFPNYEEKSKQGLIKIIFRKNKNEDYFLEVSDNGIGLPQDFEEQKKNSLGLQLIETLTAQLDAVLDIKCSPGTVFRIILKNDKGNIVNA